MVPLLQYADDEISLSCMVTKLTKKNSLPRKIVIPDHDAQR